MTVILDGGNPKTSSQYHRGSKANGARSLWYKGDARAKPLYQTDTKVSLLLETASQNLPYMRVWWQPEATEPQGWVPTLCQAFCTNILTWPPPPPQPSPKICTILVLLFHRQENRLQKLVMSLEAAKLEPRPLGQCIPSFVKRRGLC